MKPGRVKVVVVVAATAVVGADVRAEDEAVTGVGVVLVAEDATNNFLIIAARLRMLLRTIHADRLPSGGRIRSMGAEKLSLSELRRRGQSLGYTKIQRLYTSAKVPLETWNGFATESGNVDVYYVLSANQVTVFKNGRPEAHYLLS